MQWRMWILETEQVNNGVNRDSEWPLVLMTTAGEPSATVDARFKAVPRPNRKSHRFGAFSGDRIYSSCRSRRSPAARMKRGGTCNALVALRQCGIEATRVFTDSHPWWMSLDRARHYPSLASSACEHTFKRLDLVCLVRSLLPNASMRRMQEDRGSSAGISSSGTKTREPASSPSSRALRP